MWLRYYFFFFFFNDTATTEIYTLSLHDALPISLSTLLDSEAPGQIKAHIIERDGKILMVKDCPTHGHFEDVMSDRKSTRLNSSHLVISYAVFCLKKKKNKRMKFQLIY